MVSCLGDSHSKDYAGYILFLGLFGYNFVNYSIGSLVSSREHSILGGGWMVFSSQGSFQSHPLHGEQDFL